MVSTLPPAPIEGKFRESFLIEQFMVVGEGKKFVSGLILPAMEALENWCKDNGVKASSPEEMVKHPKVIC